MCAQLTEAYFDPTDKHPLAMLFFEHYDPHIPLGDTLELATVYGNVLSCAR